MWMAVYFQKRIVHLAACSWHLLIRDGLVGVPASVKLAYFAYKYDAFELLKSYDKTSSRILEMSPNILMWFTYWSFSGSVYEPLARYVKLRVVHAPGMPGMPGTPPLVSDPDIEEKITVRIVQIMIQATLLAQIGVTLQEQKTRATQNFNMTAIFQYGRRGLNWIALKMAVNGQKDYCENKLYALGRQNEKLMLSALPKCSDYINMVATFHDGRHWLSCNSSFAT